MSKFYIARKEDMACSYNEDGFGCVELLGIPMMVACTTTNAT